ncbi:MAG: GMP synthase [Gammaproteobacteria bacterium]|nr:GMP synthase [Gammaproteobacteria bacterium]
MKNYAVIQHNYSEFLGLIENQLEVRDIGFSYIRPFVGQGLPASPQPYDALFLLGGSVPPTDKESYPWIDEEIALIDRFLLSGRPVLGFGFGAQIIALWAGGQGQSEPAHTAYWTRARAANGAQDDPVAQVVDGKKVLVLYNGKVELPENTKVILEDEAGNPIAFRPEPRVYGMLFRPELKPGMLEDMVMEAGRETAANIGEVLAEARQEWEQTQKLTHQILIALTKELDLMTERKKAPVFRLNVENDDE